MSNPLQDYAYLPSPNGNLVVFDKVVNHGLKINLIERFSILNLFYVARCLKRYSIQF